MQVPQQQQQSWMYQQPSYAPATPRFKQRSITLPAIKGSQRVFLVGKTRSGKSTMARYLLEEVVRAGGRVFIIDPKKDWMGRAPHRKPYGLPSNDFKGSVEQPILTSKFNPEYRVMIYEPAEWDKNCDNIMLDAIRTGYTTIYIDEIKQLVPATYAPKNLQIAYTQGAAAGVGVWGGVQRPKGIPEIMKDQAEVWIVFRVKKREDRIDIGTYICEENNNPHQLPPILRIPLQYRWFIFYEDSMMYPVLCMPLQLDSKGKVVK